MIVRVQTPVKLLRRLVALSVLFFEAKGSCVSLLPQVVDEERGYLLDVLDP